MTLRLFAPNTRSNVPFAPSEARRICRSPEFVLRADFLTVACDEDEPLKEELDATFRTPDKFFDPSLFKTKDLILAFARSLFVRAVPSGRTFSTVK